MFSRADGHVVEHINPSLRSAGLHLVFQLPKDARPRHQWMTRSCGGHMGLETDATGWRYERRRCRRDLQMLRLCSERIAYWTNDLALRGNVPTWAETYRILVGLERRHLVKRVVCHEPISWRRTKLGELVAKTFGDR